MEELPNNPSVLDLAPIDEGVFAQQPTAWHPSADDGDFDVVLRLQSELRQKQNFVAQQKEQMKVAEDSMRKYRELLSANQRILQANEQQIAETAKQLHTAVQHYQQKLASIAGAEANAAAHPRVAAAASHPILRNLPPPPLLSPRVPKSPTPKKALLESEATEAAAPAAVETSAAAATDSSVPAAAATEDVSTMLRDHAKLLRQKYKRKQQRQQQPQHA